MKNQLINFNGAIHLASDALLPVTERLIRYGDGLFESIRAVNGKAMWLAEHYSRLYEGARLLHLPITDTLPFDAFRESVHYLLATNSYTNARMRFCLYREGGGLYTPEKQAVGYFIEATPLPEAQYTLNTEGLHIGIFTEQFKSCCSLSNFKTNNALIYVLAGIYTHHNQLDECLILNQKGCISESVSSNVFIVSQGRLKTPAAHQACVMGIMRKRMIDIATEEGIPVEEGVITLEDMLRADEIFLTNAVKGIQWVSKLFDRNYTAAMSDRLIKKLNSTIV